MNYIKTKLISFLPPRTRRALGLGVVLNSTYGHWQSVVTSQPVDSLGAPIPWYTYPAFEYLNQFDYSSCTVFEWGAGNSSLYWASVAAQVVSVEDNQEWYEIIKDRSPANLDVVLIRNPDQYIHYIDKAAQPNQSYDIIIIDGSARKECASCAVHHVKTGGMIILDNSDWYPGIASSIRETGLLQVDFHGFGPLNVYTWTTSLFFERSFGLPSRKGVQPQPSLAAIPVAAQ